MAEGLPTAHSPASVTLNEGIQVRAGVDKDRNGDYFVIALRTEMVILISVLLHFI